ncbi:MAG: hypothetical protein MUP64_01745 [Anaerolineae bacterium]|nr:hypothetical protein [Anaerolineae bacterium]
MAIVSYVWDAVKNGIRRCDEAAPPSTWLRAGFDTLLNSVSQLLRMLSQRAGDTGTEKEGPIKHAE